jgi:bifunctional N-acetylglucosamine-1-phosphate-uridyltransferase/glucosamine-1-phosphate-acetyltransferase GlmU-like protein
VTEAAALVGGEAVFGIEWSLDGPHGGFVATKDGRVLEGAALILPGALIADDAVELGPDVLVETGAMIKGPAIFGAGTHVRQGAYVRGSVLTLEGCVVGHCTEAKNLLMLRGAKAGHFNYLGDSLLGSEVNLGAGTKLANLKMLDSAFRYLVGGSVEVVDRRKFGAVLGDGVETGCNSVTSPGALLAPGCRVLPNVTVKGGYYRRRSIVRFAP